MNVIRAKRLIYKSIDGDLAKNTFTIAAGAAGWIATSIAASDVPAGAKALVILDTPTANIGYGARGTGTTQNYVGTATANRSAMVISGQRSDQSVEFYRDAGGDNNYHIIGYMK